MDLCNICNEDEGSEEHEDHGLICQDCSESLADVDDDLIGYEKSIQAQIDAEPEIHIGEDE